jgi:hypothetical protein
MSGIFIKILQAYAEGNSFRFKSARVKFTNPVFEGELIEVKTWVQPGNEIVFEGNVTRDGKKVVNVLNDGIVKLYPAH